MNCSRIFRMTVCLLLAVCLFVNVSPIRAEAFGITGIAPVDAGNVITSILIGLGLLPDVADVFNSLVNAIKSELSMWGFVYGDKMDVMTVSNSDVEDDTQYYVSQEAIEAVRDYLFKSGTVAATEAMAPVISKDSQFVISDGRHLSLPVDTYAFVFFNSEEATVCEVYLVSEEPFASYIDSWYNGDVVNTKTAKTLNYNDHTFYYAYVSASASDWLRSIGIYGVGAIEQKEFVAQVLSGEIAYGESEITVADGFKKGATIGSVEIDLSEVYKEWQKNSQQFDDENNKTHPYWPVGIDKTIADTMAKSQEEVWSGVSDYMDESLDNWDALHLDMSKVLSYLSNLLKLETWVNMIVDSIETITETTVGYFEKVVEAIQSILSLLLDIASVIFEPILDALKEAFP